jgi:hypothetical protein
MGADGLPTCVQPADGCPITTMQAKNLYDAFYNDGLFDNSKVQTIRTGAYAAWTLGKDGEYAAVTNGATFATAMMVLKRCSW